jgi:hypothetical protein
MLNVAFARIFSIPPRQHSEAAVLATGSVGFPTKPASQRGGSRRTSAIFRRFIDRCTAMNDHSGMEKIRAERSPGSIGRIDALPIISVLQRRATF